jgi:hypothetical protein
MERMSSAVRLDLRPGEWVLWKARPFRFVSLQGSTASIRDSGNAELHEVAVADLRGMPSLPPEDLDRRVDRLRTTSEESWSLAQQRESIIRELLNREGSMAERLATTPKAQRPPQRTSFLSLRASGNPNSTRSRTSLSMDIHIALRTAVSILPPILQSARGSNGSRANPGRVSLEVAW